MNTIQENLLNISKKRGFSLNYLSRFSFLSVTFALPENRVL